MRGWSDSNKEILTQNGNRFKRNDATIRRSRSEYFLVVTLAAKGVGRFPWAAADMTTTLSHDKTSFSCSVIATARTRGSNGWELMGGHERWVVE